MWARTEQQTETRVPQHIRLAHHYIDKASTAAPMLRAAARTLFFQSIEKNLYKIHFRINFRGKNRVLLAHLIHLG